MKLQMKSLEWRETLACQGETRVSRHNKTAFSLIEVMIALGIFFMATFAILGVVSNGLRNARALQQKSVSASMVAAQLSLTNKIYEGLDTGDFGDMVPGFNWQMDKYEVGSNGLFQVDMIVLRDRSGITESKMSVLFYRPESPKGSLSGGAGR